MLFNTDKYIDYIFTTRKFLSEKKYISLSSISSIITHDEIAPTICAGVSSNKTIAIKKGFSESLDRRASMLFKSKSSNYVNGVNIFDYQINKIPTAFTHFREKHPYVDTTGTAVHYSKNSAYERAILELIQKNSLFIFWYGGKGKVIEKLKLDNYQSYTVIEDTFYPVVTVIHFIFKDNYFACGLGTDVDVYKAIQAATDECLLIENMIQKSNNNYKKLDPYAYEEFISYYDKEKAFYAKNLCEKLNMTNINDEGSSFNDFLKHKPKWLNDIQTYLIPITLDDKLICVKAYSSQLFMSLPKKEFIDLEKDINYYTIRMDSNKIRNIPDIPQL